MSGAIKKLLIAVVGILVIGVVFLMFYGGSIVRSSVETYGPEITGTSVTLNDVSFSPFSGTAGLKGLVIGNPSGFDSGALFKLSAIDVAMKPSALFSDPVHIKEIRITKPEINVEYKDGKLNLKTLRDNINNYVGTESQSQTNVIIDDIYIAGAKVTVSGMPIDSANRTVDLPDIHLSNVGNEKGNQAGVTFPEATQKTMAAVTAAVTTVLADSQIQNLLGSGKKSITDKIKGLFGGGKDNNDDGSGN